MNNGLSVIQSIREEQLTRAIRFMAVVGFVVLLVSLSRTYELSWNNVFYVHISIYLLILSMAVFDKYLGFGIKALVLIGLSYIAGITGLAAWGLISLGLVALFAFCMLSTMIFGTKAGVFSVILSIFSTAVIGVGVISGLITFSFDASAFVKAYSTWLTSIMAIVFSAGIIVVILSTLNDKVHELVKNLAEKNEQLLESNNKLENALNERKELEAGLEKAHKMELVGTIAGGVAHDLNNVLSATMNYPELILLDLPEKSDLKEPMEAILKSSKKAAAIVQDLLTLTRRGVSVEKVVNLNHVLKDCLASPEFEKIMKYHPGIQMDVHLEDDLYNITGSHFHLSKTIINLISNAAEAMTGEGKIILKTQNCSFDKDIQGLEKIKAGDYAIFSIADTGTGIPEIEKEKIFEPFYTKKVMGKSGTGLGMTVVWNTVKDHKGYIDLDTAEEKGTSFNLYFPVTAKPLEKTKSDLVITEYPGKGESILIVDDVEDQRKIASKILTMLGYSVDMVSSGEKAVEYLKEHSSDLVIIDMIMAPGIDGLETYKEIIKIRPNQKTLIVSGFSETAQIREAQKLGAGAYIPKPYTIEKIGLAVRAELDRKN